MSENSTKIDEKRMPLGEHLEELRRRIIYAMLGLFAATGASLIVAPQLIGMLKGPYLDAMKQLDLPGELIVLDVSAGLITYLKVALYAGIILSSPWIFYQLWSFVSVGLYEKEKRYVRFAVPFCVILFIAGAVFFLWVVSGRVLYFLLALSKWLGMTPRITFQSHVSFMARLMVVFGLAFQTPLMILTLAATHLVSMGTFRRYRKHVIVSILVLAAAFTPPDPFSQMALAIPLWFLYELGVLLAYLLVRKEKRTQD
ncbi:MAG: twin-arginine translocase subunit TatC [Planctomycetota bacterium]|jgi:Tat protein translocase TatC